MIRLICALLATLALPPAARAAFPEKPIRMLVGFTAGGPTDVIARTVAERLTDKLRQPVVVENRPGANSSIALQVLKASAPDGHTILVGTSGALTIAPVIQKNLAYDPLKDFTPVALLSSYPYLLVVNPKRLDVKDLKGLVAYAKQHPRELSYGSTGIGTVNHLGAEQFWILNGIELVHVPYRGNSEAMVDIAAGHIPVYFATLTGAAPQVRAGTIRPLAITAKARTPLFPDVPTIADLGIPNFELVPWNGLLAPAGTPADVVATINGAVNESLRHPDVQRRLAEFGLDGLSDTPEAFRKLIETDLERWRSVAATVKVELN